MKKELIFLIICVSLVLIGLGAYSAIENTLSANSNAARDNAAINKGVKEIKIKAFKFGYNPDVVTIKKGEKIRITIDNADALHGIRIPELGIQGDAYIEFIPERKGEFAWYCNNLCGEGHGAMGGRLIIN